MLCSEDSSLPLNSLARTEANVNQTDAAYGITTANTSHNKEKTKYEQELSGYLIPQSARMCMRAYLDSSSVCDSSNEVMDTTQTIMSKQKVLLQSPRNAPNNFSKLSMGTVKNNSRMMGFRKVLEQQKQLQSA